MRRDPAIVDLNHLVQTPHSATLLLLVHLASIPGVSTPPLVLSARVPQFKCAKESVRYQQGEIRMHSTTRLGRNGTCFSVFLPIELPEAKRKETTDAKLAS